MYVCMYVCTYTHQLHLVHDVHPSITVLYSLFYSRSGRYTGLHIYTCACMVRPTGAQVETMVTRYTLLGIEIHDELQMCKITKCRVQALYTYIYIYSG